MGDIQYACYMLCPHCFYSLLEQTTFCWFCGTAIADWDLMSAHYLFVWDAYRDVFEWDANFWNGFVGARHRYIGSTKPRYK